MSTNGYMVGYIKTFSKNDSTAKIIEYLLWENKEAKVLELENELRNIVISDYHGILFFHQNYFPTCSITSGPPLVFPKYVIDITLCQRSPLSLFIEMLSILTLKEEHMIQNQNQLVQVTHPDSFSSLTFLM